MEGMVGKKSIMAVVMVAIAVIAIAGAIYILNLQGGPSQTGGQEVKSVTITDGTGRNVTINLPVKKIISLNSGITELLYALQCEDRIIARDQNSNFPRAVLDKPIVASSSYDPNIELILQMSPDLVLADDMLFYNKEALGKIENAGIAVIMENTSNVTRVKTVIANLGRILECEDKANEIIDFIEQYEKLVQERIKGVPESGKPQVYIEWWAPWQSFAIGSAGNKIIYDAGGINIAGEINNPAPILSPEFVVDKNPDIILRMAPINAIGNLTAFKAVRNEILNRPELREVKAVKNGKVYVYDPVILEGLRYPIGLLYWAKCFNPNLFADIDPEALHVQLIQKYFGGESREVYFYPSP
jgi:iron complex transport system substrate-binding protein